MIPVENKPEGRERPAWKASLQNRE